MIIRIVLIFIIISFSILSIKYLNKYYYFMNQKCIVHEKYEVDPHIENICVPQIIGKSILPECNDVKIPIEFRFILEREKGKKLESFTVDSYDFKKYNKGDLYICRSENGCHFSK